MKRKSQVAEKTFGHFFFSPFDQIEIPDFCPGRSVQPWKNKSPTVRCLTFLTVHSKSGQHPWTLFTIITGNLVAILTFLDIRFAELYPEAFRCFLLHINRRSPVVSVRDRRQSGSCGSIQLHRCYHAFGRPWATASRRNPNTDTFQSSLTEFPVLHNYTIPAKFPLFLLIQSS